jgi:hypothetical protein
MTDNVNHPSHYNSHPSGVECITITEHMSFCRGNAIKYIWRAGEKGGSNKEIEDLEKAQWYLKREIERLKKCNTDQNHTPLRGSKLNITA